MNPHLKELIIKLAMGITLYIYIWTGGFGAQK